MNNPKHIKKVPDDRKAIAPYNFVELPDKVVEAQELPSNDKYNPSQNTGKIECTLTTSSPLYIRCGLTKAEFAQGKEAKGCPDFFYTDKSEKPVIPGSSLRGMLRTLVEIVSFSKIDRVSDKEPFFFRAVAAETEDPLKQIYQINEVKTGYLKFDKNTEKWFIEFNKFPNYDQDNYYIPVKESEVEGAIPSLVPMKNPNYLPQYIKISFKIGASQEEILVDENEEKYRENKGWLVTSGDMLETSNLKTESDREKKLKSKEGRKYHYIIPELGKSAARLEISVDAINDYKSSLTDFQKGKLFEENPNENPFNKDSGFLKDGRPVFFSQPKPGEPIKLFGQSPNFRIPYIPKGRKRAATVVDFIPPELRFEGSKIIDIADAIFGWARDNKKSEEVEQNRAGRVFVNDAKYENNKSGIWYKGNKNDTVTPQILASPKPTTFQHYLVQPEEINSEAKREKLKHYASDPNETAIRGHKLYWHKGEKPKIELEGEASDTQTTKIKPIKPGVSFKFDIHFENLTNVELGALMWVLDIAQDEKYRLKLGMGKPLGMGAVKIESELFLSDRPQRYERLFDGNNDWFNPFKQEEPNFKECFETYMLEKLPNYNKSDFNELHRVQMLQAMLSWSGLSKAVTRYMEIERKKPSRISKGKGGNEYGNRPVLPTPLQVMGIKSEPDRFSSLPNSSDNNPPQSSETNNSQESKFSEGQIVDAKVVEVKKKNIQKGKKEQLKTTITYQIEGSDCQSTEVVDKKDVDLKGGEIVKVTVKKTSGSSIRKVKRLE